ncbi:hypothetical protein TRFO_40582 [Tritrichomonas foetus]|uniref:Uncharacterized protein n=1 Tax=Tritrichomonas foetus TaxID=1144522 RepID=A0A1J4J0K9_9EUKA|nr:hypothetical protein TRFO_40582 [Tritrichomonas foetus]|eukprot:OHS93112.1 hypothetical protein TRFO_40582 [Tritrichomonas foetus]
MQVEQSQISTRSASSANQNTGFRRKVALGQVSFIDIVFPLMDNIMQHTRFPFILTSFVALFFYLQVVFSALWPVSKFWNFQTPNMTESKTHALALAVQNLPKIDHLSNFTDLTKTNISMKNLNESIFLGASKLLAHEEAPVQTEQSKFAKIFNIVQIVFWFTEHNPTRSYLTYELVVLAVITVICWGFIGYSLFRYHSLHRFEKWLLYATRAILEVAAPILFHPAAAFTGSAIKLLVQTKETILWAYVVVGIFVLVCCIALFISGFMLSSVSAYLNVTHYSMFDPTTLCTMGAISSLFITFSFIASLFPDWLMNFLQALHLVASAVIIFMMSYMPFHKLSGTCIAIAALETGALLDITMIIFINVDNVITQVPDYAPFVMMIALFIISAVLTGIYLRACKKKIVKNLTNNRNEDGERMTEEEKNERFISLGLHLNESKALMYLRVGFQNHCDLFIDWSLLRFIASNYQTNSAIAACVQILAFFPGESRQLNAFFNSAIMKKNLGYSHRFLIFQVYRIKTLRQSSASSDANEKLAELKRLSQQCEAEINGFWASNDSNPGYFEVISTQVQSLNALWLEAIRDFPNNSKFSDEYCRFLTECATDFEMAIVQKQRSEMIEMGTNFSVDISFRSMVKNYPEYLKKDILDLKGNVRSRTTKNKGSTASSGSNKDSSFSTSNIEVDAELENSLGKLLFRHSKLRIALHHSLKGRTLQSMTLTPVAGAISVIASFAAFIGLFVYFKQTYQERGTSMDRLNFISKTRFNYAVANIILLCDFLEQTGRMNNFVEMDTEMLEEDDHDSEYIDHHIEYSQQIMDYNILSRDNFTTLLDEISILSFNGIDVYDLAGELFNDMVNITTCYDNQQLTAFANNMKNLMVLGYLHQSELAGLSKKDLFYNDEYCEILANWNSLQTAADSVFRSFSDEQVTRGNDLTNTGEFQLFFS